jgi:S-DNA-T family DNA segregation ATPase FtsK/SpoIIIE
MVNSGSSVSSGDVSSELLWAVARLLGIAVRGAIRLVWWSILFPMLSLPIATAIGFALIRDWAWFILTVGVSAAGLLAWAQLAPQSYRACVSGRIWKRRRSWKVYRARWAEVCALHGLTRTLNGGVLIPPLGKPVIGYAFDRLTVLMLAGQTIGDWSRNAEALAQTFGARSVQVRSPRPAVVELLVLHADTLAAVRPVLRPNEKVDLARVAVGVTEMDQPWLMKIIGCHLLIAGATGAGKGSVVWSLIAGIAPAVRDGWVALWVIDPKGGMELGRGTDLFARFSFDAGESSLALLRDAATILAERANRLRGVTRQHVPTVNEPLILIVIDELASLTAYQSDRKIRAELEQALGLILSQGRAVGVSVVACVQDPSKEVISLRQLFPTRVGLRMSEPSQVGMALGMGARERGALCDLISDREPGVAYVAEDGTADITRVRSFFVSDEDIDLLAAIYSRPDAELSESPAGDGTEEK